MEAIRKNHIEILALKYNWNQELDWFKNHLMQLKSKLQNMWNFQGEKKQWQAGEGIKRRYDKVLCNKFGLPKVEEEANRAEIIFEDVMVKNFRKLMKDNPDTNSESSMNPNKRSRNKIT